MYGYPGIKILIMRKTYNEVFENHIRPMLSMVDPSIYSYNGTTHLMTFENGSSIKFGHWAGEQSENEYNGLEYDWIFIDEATQFTERTFDFLGGCLRGTNNIPKRMYLTCNPKNKIEEDFFKMRKYKTEFNIYRIVNDIDGMVYIGSTSAELWHRLSQHKADAKKGEKSPLYELMRNYGVEHFRIERIKVSTKEKLREDEEIAINSVPASQRLNHKMTSHRDAQPHFDYDEICRVYKECESQNMTANIIGCSRVTVQKALRAGNIPIIYPPHTAHYLRGL